MKQSITLLLLLFATLVSAQVVPSGMKYQAVARDAKGEVLANKNISIQITLLSDTEKSKSDYIEEHQVLTNQFGLFTLTIGEGDIRQGAFSAIPWSTKQVLLELAVDDQGSGDFQIVHTGRLLAVPYAFHAATATTADEVKTQQKDGGELYWRLEGNKDTNQDVDYFGTNDYQDIVVKTNSMERMRVHADGNVQIFDAYIFKVKAKQIDITDDLNVVNNTTLGGTLDVVGATTLESTLDVSGETIIDNTLDVAEATTLENTLDVSGATDINNTLDVTDATHLKNTLDVTGATNLDNTLTVDGKTTLNETLELSKDDAEFVAFFENTNGNQGDGLQIKLGRTHSAWDGGAYLNLPNPGVEIFEDRIDLIKSWISGDVDETLIIESILTLVPYTWTAGSACNLVEAISDPINEQLGLPIAVPEISIPATSITIPSLSIPGLPAEFCPDFLPGISVPNINILNVDNTLDKENQFLSFVDKEDRELGAIQAVSITDWYEDYFSGLYAVNFIGSVIGIDVLGLALGAVMEFSNIADSYNSLGVEYASGNGDYAEWLERINPNEVITSGDIVGVIGGKITKNIEDAEQIMAISKKPIVLGNIPPKAQESLGNKVAFMGQIPVKVIGAVSSGDYIIANDKVPGYGKAVHPENMTLADFKLVVGRAWDANEYEGPKQINTVIGVHNGDYLKILNRYQQKLQTSEVRLENLESKVDRLSNLIESKITH